MAQDRGLKTIREFVRAKLDEGLTIWQAYEAARAEFAHRCAGWNYVRSIARQWAREKIGG